MSEENTIFDAAMWEIQLNTSIRFNSQFQGNTISSILLEICKISRYYQFDDRHPDIHIAKAT